MLSLRNLSAAFILALSALLAMPSSAFALAGLLRHPGVAIAVKSNVDSKGVASVLANKKYQYVTGSFINSHSTLFYSGSSAKLSDFLNDLAGVKGVKLSVIFSKKRGVADTTWFGKEGKSAPCQWMVSHFPGQFSVMVYLGDGTIRKDDVNIPPGIESQDEGKRVRIRKLKEQ